MNKLFKYLPIIKYRTFTEKTAVGLESNQYTFIVNRSVNKQFIKKTIETLLKVKISKINTAILPLKQKRKKFNRTLSTIIRPKVKKVIITVYNKNLTDIFKN